MGTSNSLTPNRPKPNKMDFPAIRPIGLADLKACVELSIDRGWWPERGKWALLLEASDAWGIDAPDGQGLAGTVVLTRWGTDRAGLGMMLVAARYGGQGLGRALMEYALDAAGENTAVSLFATNSGRPLYDKLGFQPIRRSIAFRGTFRADAHAKKSKRGARAEATASPGNVRDATEADLEAILTLDRAAYGSDRERIMTRLPGFAERIVVLEAGEGIVGYAAAWRTEPFTMIGPLMAPDGEGARRLVTELAAHSTTMIRLDIDPDRPELPDWSRAHGLIPTERTVMMTRARADLTLPRGIPEHLYTPISVACC
jgi:GNAT superfamily N-acetyltransferase